MRREVIGRSNLDYRSRPATKVLALSWNWARALRPYKRASAWACRGSTRPAVTASIASRPGKPSAPTPSSVATRATAGLPYILADPNYVAHIPVGLAPCEAAPIICAGVTTYKGIKEADVRPGQWIVISGVGGLGHLAVQYAKAMGLRVCAVDIDERKLAHATQLGADAVVNAKSKDPIAAVIAATKGGAHGVLITAPSLGAFKQGVAMTRKLGTCVLVGLPPGEFPMALFDVVANCITVRGSFVGNRQDMAEALAFAAEGKVRADIELQPLSAINQVFERLERGDVPARVVIDFSAD